jgi:hypothetical protein
MKCCDEYGDCCQSDTYPVRTGKVLPHQAQHAARVARVKTTHPIWMDGLVNPVPPEAGNFKIIDLGPDDSDCQPMSHDESMRLVRTLLSWLLAVLATVGALALAVSYSTEAHAAALWALLQGVS